MMNKDYGSWSLADLKSELQKRNAKVSGKKTILVQRLEDYDRLFGQLVSNPESAFKIVVPSPEHFWDVTSDSLMPVLTEDDLEAFCVLTERIDKATSYNMYEECFLISCRSALKDEHYFVTGVCASEMRKNVMYNVTIKCKDHLIVEAQCECAAGEGPHGQCKHVMVLLYGIIDFNKKKAIKLKSSITSTLQTFHHPNKNYTGNPIRAENLTLKFKDKKMKEMTKFDPRPTESESVDKYTENFKSLIANYYGGKSGNIPIAHILKPADKRALFRDHDYFKKTAEEEFFDSIKLSEDQLKKLECETKNNKKEWTDKRKLRLHSSSFGRICKQNTNKLNLAKSLLKTSHLQTPAIKHGKKYEAEAIKEFEKITGLAVTKSGIIINPEYQFLGSTPDGLVGNELLEVKCPFTARNKNISGDSVPYLYLCEKSGKLKLNETHDYYYQIQGQMLCAQKAAANFFVYTFCDSCLIKIERDNKFIEEMVKNLESFYDNYYKHVLLDRFLYGNK